MHRQGTKVLAQTTLETGAPAPCSVGKLLAMELSGIARKSAFWSSSTWFCAGKRGLVEIYPKTTTKTVNWKRYVLSMHWFKCTYLSVYLYNYRFAYLMLLIYLCIFISIICLFGCVFVCWFIHSRTHPGVIFKTLSGIVWDLPRIYPRNISMFLSKAACKYGLRTCLMKALDDILSQPKIIWSPPKKSSPLHHLHLDAPQFPRARPARLTSPASSWVVSSMQKSMQISMGSQASNCHAAPTP